MQNQKTTINFSEHAEFVNGSDFCNIVGVNIKSLSRAVESGRVKPELKNGHKMYHLKNCCRDYANNTRVMLQNADLLKRMGRTDVDEIIKAKLDGTYVDPKKEIENKTPEKKDTPNSLSAEPEYIESKKKSEKYTAQLKELEYLKKAGEVVSVSEIENKFFTMARGLRNQLLNLPVKLAPMLSGENDLKRIEIILTDEITKTLTTISVPNENGDLENVSVSN